MPRLSLPSRVRVCVCFFEMLCVCEWRVCCVLIFLFFVDERRGVVFYSGHLFCVTFLSSRVCTKKMYPLLTANTCCPSLIFVLL